MVTLHMCHCIGDVHELTDQEKTAILEDHDRAELEAELTDEELTVLAD